MNHESITNAALIAHAEQIKKLQEQVGSLQQIVIILAETVWPKTAPLLEEWNERLKAGEPVEAILAEIDAFVKIEE